MDILLWIILNKCNTFVLCLGIEMCVECCGVFHKKIYILWKNIWIRRRVIIEPYFLPNLFVCDFSASVITMNGLMIFWFNIRSCFVYQCQWLRHIVEAIWTIIENDQLRPGLLRYIVHVNRSDRLTCCMLKFNFAIVYLQNIPFTQLSFFYLPGIFNDTWKILTYDKRIVLTS